MIHADVCSNCHPFYTGKQKILDTGGRVARFERRFGKQASSRPAASIRAGTVPFTSPADVAGISAGSQGVMARVASPWPGAARVIPGGSSV